MQVQVNIEFDQLVKIAKKLPADQWRKLRLEVEGEKQVKSSKKDLESFLLGAPTFTKKQLDTVAKTRKSINQWRTK